MNEQDVGSTGAMGRAMGRPVAVAALTVALACFGLMACGEAPPPQETTWRPSDRLPLSAQHWWWDPVEYACAEDSDCESGETCQRMRLGTCPECPRGEDAHVCVDREGQPSRADSETRTREREAREALRH